MLGVMSGIVLVICGIIYNFVYPIKYKEDILTYSDKFQLSPSLVSSIIYVESHFKKDSVSNRGAVGLMQIMPNTAESFYDGEFDAKMLKNPSTNIEIGCRFLNYLFDKYGEINMVLACYNAGETQARAWKGGDKILALSKITFAETRNYILKVKKFQNVYKNRF